MADLSEIDLGGPTSAEYEESSSEETLDLGYEEDIEIDAHVGTEDLHLYFNQSLSSKVGKTGLVIISMISITLVMITATLLLSYTPPGREFLQNLIFYIF